MRVVDNDVDIVFQIRVALARRRHERHGKGDRRHFFEIVEIVQHMASDFFEIDVDFFIGELMLHTLQQRFDQALAESTLDGANVGLHFAHKLLLLARHALHFGR